MKGICRLGLAALLLPALVACPAHRPGEKIDWQDGEMVAVAFLGYYDSFAAFEASPSYTRLTKTFPQIVEATQVECGLGREIFLVVPRDPGATLAVNENGKWITDENREVFYRSEEGKPVLLLNNWFEDNSQVVCTDSTGVSLTYVPAIDSRSGKLRKPDDGRVRDISLPLPEPMEGYASSEYGQDFDGRSFGIKVRLEAGRPVLNCSAAPLTMIGYDEDSIVLADGDNEFSGINGLCKGVFIGNIGQDYNPVACVVMENGDVKMASIFYAMQHGGPDLSVALPGFKDVIGLESGGGGPWEDEESGEVFYEYETIYALDARGGRTEIPYFPDFGTFVASGDGHFYEAILTPDWNVFLTRYEEDGELCEVSHGSFFEDGVGDSVHKFRFHAVYEGRSEGGEEFVGKPVSRTGSFTAVERGLSYEVSLTGADYFKSGLVFRDERLLDAEDDIEYD
ncbi:MAG: hypothetical protein IKX62_03085 [Bacteroidales bacterium]|nr:hypothetical protein [Bacteroidales bacterium]